MKKIYRGKIRGNPPRALKRIVVVETEKRSYTLRPYLTEVKHSPTGFNWGYVGSGPAQLAYAILRDYGLSKDEAMKLYMKFKDQVIANLDMDKEFELTSDEIEEWLASPTE